FCAAFSAKPLSTATRKPSFSTRTVYVPTGRLGATNSPDALLTWKVATPVAVLVTVTRALATSAPVGSVSVPDMVPRSDWASAADANRTRSIQLHEAIRICCMAIHPFGKSTYHKSPCDGLCGHDRLIAVRVRLGSI